MKDRYLSLLELQLILLFFLGVICNYFYTQYSFFFIIELYLFGLFFEYSTNFLWFYNPSIVQSIFAIRGVNILLGLGWVGGFLIGICLAEFLSRNFFNDYWFVSLMLGVGITGNIIEQFLYNIGLFTYNLDSKLLAYPLKKVILIWNIPLSIRYGYFISMPLIAYFLIYVASIIEK